MMKMTNKQKLIASVVAKWLAQLSSTNDIGSPSHSHLIEARIESEADDLEYEVKLKMENIMQDLLKLIRDVEKDFTLQPVQFTYSEFEALESEIVMFMGNMNIKDLEANLERIKTMRSAAPKNRPHYMSRLTELFEKELERRLPK